MPNREDRNKNRTVDETVESVRDGAVNFVETAPKISHPLGKAMGIPPEAVDNTLNHLSNTLGEHDREQDAWIEKANNPKLADLPERYDPIGYSTRARDFYKYLQENARGRTVRLAVVDSDEEYDKEEAYHDVKQTNWYFDKEKDMIATYNTKTKNLTLFSYNNYDAADPKKNNGDITWPNIHLEHMPTGAYDLRPEKNMQVITTPIDSKRRK